MTVISTQQTAFMSHDRAMERQKRELASLHPAFVVKITALLRDMNTKGWQAFVYQGKTRTAEQAAENVKKKTGIKKSWHRPDVFAQLKGQIVSLYAVDIVDERWGWEGPAKDLRHPFWNDLGGFAKAAGLQWGGDWKNKDVAHVQIALIDAPRPTDSVVV